MMKKFVPCILAACAAASPLPVAAMERTAS